MTRSKPDGGGGSKGSGSVLGSLKTEGSNLDTMANWWESSGWKTALHFSIIWEWSHKCLMRSCTELILESRSLLPRPWFGLPFLSLRGGILNGLNRLEREQIIKTAVEVWHDAIALVLRCSRCRQDTVAFMNLLLHCYYASMHFESTAIPLRKFWARSTQKKNISTAPLPFLLRFRAFWSKFRSAAESPSREMGVLRMLCLYVMCVMSVTPMSNSGSLFIPSKQS